MRVGTKTVEPGNAGAVQVATGKEEAIDRVIEEAPGMGPFAGEGKGAGRLVVGVESGGSAEGAVRLLKCRQPPGALADGGGDVSGYQ